MSIGISEMFANSNKQARQSTRSKIFSENHTASVLYTIIFAILGSFFLAGDLALDQDYTFKSIIYRSAILAVLLVSALLKKLSKSVYFNYAVAYLSLVFCEILLTILLNGLDGGLKAGVSQFIYFYLGTLLCCALFPFNYNIFGCIVLTIIPFAIGIPFAFNFPITLYASVLIPALIVTILILYKIRFLSVETQNSRLEMEVSAMFDPVTGLLNFRGFERMYLRMVRLGLFKTSQQFLLLIELHSLENLKALIGEKQVQQFQVKIAEIIESSLDVRNITARFGENEYACLLQHVTQEKASAYAEAIRKAVADKDFDCPSIETGKVNYRASIGIVSADPKDEIKTLINRGRISLNQAVQLGGNQCVLIARAN